MFLFARKMFHPQTYSILKIVISILGAVAFSSAHFGAGSGTIYLDGVSCSNSEERLLDCPRNSVVSCSGHSEDAGVRCQGMYSL